MSDDLGRFRGQPRNRPRSSPGSGPEIEFLTGDDPGDGGELLDTGPRRPVPRWVLIGGVLLVLAVLVIVAARHGGGGAPVATPSDPVHEHSDGPVVQAVPNLAISDAYSLVGDERTRRLFALSDAGLFAIRPDGQQVGHGVPVQVGGNSGEIELVLDSDHHLIWAVPQHATGHDGHAAGYAEPFDTRTLHADARIPLPGLVESAAVLDGDLYVTTDLGLWRTTTLGEPFAQVAGPVVGDDFVVADPTRHRLLCVRFASHTTVRTYGRTSGVSSPSRVPARTISLAVVDRTIWIGGSRGGHALLARLDPRTLRTGPDLAHGTADVELQAVGRRSLFVSVGSRLHCLAATTGRPLADLGRLRGAFAAVGGRGFFGTRAALHPVAMGRCPG